MKEVMVVTGEGPKGSVDYREIMELRWMLSMGLSPDIWRLELDCISAIFDGSEILGIGENMDCKTVKDSVMNL